MTKEELERQGYFNVVTLPNGELAALFRFIFTVAIITEMNDYGYNKRWCYEELVDAQQNLLDMASGKITEPVGWKRKTHV